MEICGELPPVIEQFQHHAVIINDAVGSDRSTAALNESESFLSAVGCLVLLYSAIQRQDVAFPNSLQIGKISNYGGPLAAKSKIDEVGNIGHTPLPWIFRSQGYGLADHLRGSFARGFFFPVSARVDGVRDGSIIIHSSSEWRQAHMDFEESLEDCDDSLWYYLQSVEKCWKTWESTDSFKQYRDKTAYDVHPPL